MRKNFNKIVPPEISGFNGTIKLWMHIKPHRLPQDWELIGGRIDGFGTKRDSDRMQWIIGF